MRTHVILYRLIAACKPFLIAKTLKSPLHRMALLLRAIQIFKKPLINLVCETSKLWPTNILTALVPGGIGYAHIFLTVPRAKPKSRAIER